MLMLGSKEQHSRQAAERLLAKAEAWNRERARNGNEMVLIYSTASYTQGADVTSWLDRLRQELMVQRKSLGLELASSLSQTGSATPLIRLGVSFGDSVDPRWPEAEIQQVN